MGPWANVSDSCIEPKLEMDDTMGMMPPPPTTTIPMGVRRSSASSTMLSDQISQLKTEIMDDNSSNSPADSLDRFPVTPTGENMVNNTVMDHSFHNVRDQNLNVLDMRNLPMLQNANFTTQQQMIQSGSETVDKFISNITANMPSNGEPSIADFVHAAAVAAAVSDQPVQVPMQMTQLITNLSSPQAESPTSLERARSNSMSNSSGSPQSSSNGFESTISHDIILNSNSAASLMINSATPTTSQQQGEHITTDIIMNSSVAPTVICPQTDPITLNQVAMATSILSDIAAGQNQDQVTTNLINNIISANASTQPQVVSTTDSAISVMMSLTESQSDQVSQILNNQPPVLSTNTLVNMLHQQPQLGSVPVPATNAGFLNPSLPTVQIAAINSLTTQESLMVPNNHPVVQQVGQQVPQEVSAMSAMSEQDLISYINPSAFDQV
ncbi:NFAT5 family protein [Megaselia abdita]